MIEKTDIDRVIAATDFAEILRIEGVKLKDKGNNSYSFLCFAHDEKTPSMHLNKEGICHCFGCGWTGNVINFMTDINGVDFLEAIGSLATRAGISLEHTKDSQKENEQDFSQKLLTSIENWALTHKYTARLVGDKPLSAVGVGFMPSDIDNTRIKNLLKDPKAKEVMDLLQIEQTSNGFKGPEQFAWFLSDGLTKRTTGVALFDLHNNPSQKKMPFIQKETPTINFLPGEYGFAIGKAKAMHWSRLANISVVTSPVTALNLHARSEKFGSAAFLPMPHGADIPISVYDSLLNHNKMTFISNYKKEMATFCLKVLNKVKDSDTIQFYHPPTKTISSMSEFLITLFNTVEPDKSEMLSGMMANVLADNNRSKFFKNMMNIELNKFVPKINEEDLAR